MVIQVKDNYNLSADPSWRAVQLMEVYLECDTTLNPITINLFPIYQLDYFWNVKIYVTDNTNNASNNPITINCFNGDTLDGVSSVVISQNNGGCALLVMNNNTWLANETSETGNTYKFAQLPTSVVSSAQNNSQLYGELYDTGAVFPPANYVIRLANGSLSALFYPQTILSDGTLIYEAYEITPTALISGYWVAMRPNPLDNSKLIKVAELQMTQQFWDNYYEYTYQSEIKPNEVTFLAPIYPYADGVTLESYNTLLSLENNVLIATDDVISTNKTTLDLYNDLTGNALLTGTWTYSTPLFSMEDDYSRMMNGPKAGWVFFGEDGVGNFVVQAGYNILTGATMIIKPITSLSFTTNLNPIGTIDDTYFNLVWIGHPLGTQFLVTNNQIVDNGDNTNGISAVFSPVWDNNTRVKFLPIRDLFTGEFINTSALLFNTTLSASANYGFDATNIYLILGTYSSATYGSQAFKISKIALDTFADDITESVLPALVDTSIYQPTIWESKNGIFMFWIGGFALETFAEFVYYYWNFKKLNPILLQSNNAYPTNVLGSKIYSTSSQLNRNATALTIEFDIYNQKF